MIEKALFDTVACGSIPIKTLYFDFPKRFINRINEAVAIFYWKIKMLIYIRLFCCNHMCYCVSMVSVTSASRYVTSASRYQSRSSMNIQGLIP